MSFFDQSDYRINKFLMSAIGLWPYQTTLQKICFCSVCIFFNITMIITMVVGAVTCDELDDTIKLVAPILTGVTCGARFLNCLLNSKRMKRLLDQIQTDWTTLTDEEFLILKHFSKRGRMLTVLYEVYIYGNLFVYLNVASLDILKNITRPLNGTRSFIRTYKSDYFVDEEKYYLQMLVHEYIASFINVTTMLSVDTMYAVFTEHVCGMFVVLRHRVENIIENGERNFESEDCLEGNNRIVNITMNCIALHQRSIDFANTLDTTFSYSQLVQTSLNIVSLSVSGYMIIVKLNKLNECLQFCAFALGILIWLLYSCIPGEKMQNYSQDAADSVYHSLWFHMPLKIQKHLLLIMVRSGQPCKLQAGKLFVLSLQFFTKCIQTSFSYLTMLLTVRQNKQ